MDHLSYKSPLYIQLREVIRNKIEEGEYPPGTAIPSENQLAESYGISRLSVRSALQALEYEGILTSIQGKGVYVSGQKDIRDLDTLGGYRNRFVEHSVKERTKVLIKAVRKAGPYYSKLLEIDPDEDIWYIQEIHRDGDTPAALSEIYFPCNIIPNLEEMDIRVFSLYDAFCWNNHQPGSVDQRLEAARIDKQRAKHLGLTEGQAVMKLSCCTRDIHGTMIEFARYYVRGDRTEFSVKYKNQELDKL